MAAKNPPRKRSLYDILGVPRDAMAIDIGMAYKKRLAELDRTADADPNEAALVREAYHILCQPKEREAYDASLITREERDRARTQPAPDIVLEAEDDATRAESKKKKTLWLAVAALALVVATLAILLARPGADRKPAVASAPPEAAAATAPPPPPPPKKRSAAEILGLVAQSIAVVTAYDMSGKPKPVGGGLVVAADAIVTTCHALPPSATLVARIGGATLAANLVLFDEVLDLCRLSVERVAVTPLAPGSDEPKPGDTVHAIGPRKGGELTLVEVTVKSVRATPNARMIEINLPAAADVNGGGLFDAYGRLVGVLDTRAGGANAATSAQAIARMRTRGRAAPAPAQ